MVASLGDCAILIHFILAMCRIEWTYWPIINDSLITLSVLTWHLKWAKYGENDMGSFELQGPFRPGFKRFKSEQYGNDCMMFYPVCIREVSTQVEPYRDIDAYLEGTKTSG